MLVEHKTQPAGGASSACDQVGGAQRLPGPATVLTAAVHLDADRAVVMLHGELDLMGVAVLVDCFGGIAPTINEVVVDFAELDFLECSGLHAIAAAAQAAGAPGGSLSIRSPHPQSQRLLNLVNFEQIVANHS